MLDNFKKMQVCYENLYNLSVKIAECIQSSDVDSVNILLSERKKHHEELQRLVKKEYTEEQKSKIREMGVKLKEVEDSNLADMINLKTSLLKQDGKLRRNNRVLNAYSVKKYTGTSGIDSGA